MIRLEVDRSALPAHLAHGDFEPDASDCPSAPVVPCGGFIGLPCPDGSTCVDAPGDGCDSDCGADCPGVCVTTPPVPCGPHGRCADGATCVDDPTDACYPDCGDAGCPTICVRMTTELCGGFGGFVCPADLECVDVPGDGCDQTGCPLPDCLGQCASLALPCGGPNGDSCPSGFTCVDDESDTCNPDCGDVDCAGVCVVLLSPP
jgi:hypothetical protein